MLLLTPHLTFPTPTYLEFILGTMLSNSAKKCNSYLSLLVQQNKNIMMLALNILYVGNSLEPDQGKYGRESIIKNPKQTVQCWRPTAKKMMTLLLTWMSSILLHDF